MLGSGAWEEGKVCKCFSVPSCTTAAVIAHAHSTALPPHYPYPPAQYRLTVSKARPVGTKHSAYVPACVACISVLPHRRLSSKAAPQPCDGRSRVIARSVHTCQVVWYANGQTKGQTHMKNEQLFPQMTHTCRLLD